MKSWALGMGVLAVCAGRLRLARSLYLAAVSPLSSFQPVELASSWADRQVKLLVDEFSIKKSASTRGSVWLSTRRASTCPSSALGFLSAKLRQRRQEIGTRWRRLSAGRQALLTLAHLRNGHPYAQLAAGFGIGTTTAYRYITEPVEALAALAPALTQAVRTASSKAFVLLDGTLLPIDRIAADRPYYSGKPTCSSP